MNTMSLHRGVKSCRGFTLLEVMVALVILSIMMAIAASSLFMMVKTKQRVEERVAQLEALQITVQLLTQDLNQAVGRPIMDGQGALQLSFAGTVSPHILMEFTRMGYLNPLATIRRSNMQRIAYEVKNQQLIRVSWPVLDRAPTTVPMNVVLLEGVKSMQIRYLSDNLQFYPQWPPLIPNYPLIRKPLPRAVEVTWNLEALGIISQLFEVPSSGFGEYE